MVKQTLKSFIVKLFSPVIEPVLQKIDEVSEKEMRSVQRLISISNLHQKTFLQYKGCYCGKDIVLVGAGPSIKDFKLIDDCIYVGLNRACLINQIKFDYLFSIDKSGIDNIYTDFASVECIKFIGDQNLGPAYQIPESEAFKMGNVLRYKTDIGIYHESKFALNIESEPLGNFNSVSLQAMQFILYTNPRRIYLVGIDCSNLGHFEQKQSSLNEHKLRMQSRGEDLNRWANDTIKSWDELKKFASLYYPETSIISVNPVGLRGMFIDMDQR